MRQLRGGGAPWRRGTLAFAALVLALSCADLVLGNPTGQWPNFHKRNVQALARDGLLRNSGGANDLKRSISTLAKNGQLPTFGVPEDNSDDDEDEPDEEKRNLAAIARLKSYAAKRNLAALMRTGYRTGKRDFNEYKRNIAALARNGYLKTDQDNAYQKRESSNEGEYFIPFYQNPIPPISEMDVPLDYNELYDLEQSNHPDLLPPLSELYDKRNVAALLRQDAYNVIQSSPHYRPFPTPYGGEDEFDQVNKRSSIGLPNHGLYKTITPTVRTQRYLLTIPELIYNEGNWPAYDPIYQPQEKKSVDTQDEARGNFDKRHISALARLGWLPSSRSSGSRYSRAGRARFFVPNFSDSYRKHSDDEDSGAGEYITYVEDAPKASADNADLPPPPVSANSYPAGRVGGRPVNRPDDSFDAPTIPSPDFQRFIHAINRNRWEPHTAPQFYNFRSLKIPKQRAVSNKRYLLLPAVDNFMLRKTYPNNNLPSRRKNQ